MRNRNLWISFSLINLSVLALLGMILRTKFLFYIPAIDYKAVMSAHSHFAFGGWVTLILMTLFVDTLLLPEHRNKKIYQVALWGIQLSSYGMVLVFPFQGYSLLAIIFSTLFILFTYVFSWSFLRDINKAGNKKSVSILSISAVICLVISSIGPFLLAYILATNSGDANLFRVALYTFLHFQYNGFFTLATFALLFATMTLGSGDDRQGKFYRFSVLLSLSIIPSLLLSLLWHPDIGVFIKWIAYTAVALIIASLYYFFSMFTALRQGLSSFNPVARSLFILAMISFTVKMLLQTGTIIPWLGNAVYGFRPIIIGFLHLVFLGFVTLFILSHLVQYGFYSMRTRLAQGAIILFTGAVIFNELVLLVDGIGLLFYTTHKIYGWLLWAASILLFFSALMIAVSHLRTRR